MSPTPSRPESIPDNAWWDAKDQEWVSGALVGEKEHGVFTYWRADGTKCNECRFAMGVPHGPFRRFHQNGEVSQEGAYERGQFHGTRRWFSTDSETTEKTRAPGVSEQVWVSEMDYQHGKVVGIRHFNREGIRVSPTSGEPYPSRPPSVDERAEYVEPKDEWHRGDADGETQKKTGRWQVWTRQGQPKEDVFYVDDERHGPATLWVVGPNPFADERIVQQRGQYAHGHRVGLWLLCDANGIQVNRCDYGQLDALEGPPLLAYSNDGTVDYAAHARACEGENRWVEALVSWARVLGRTKDASPFRALLTRVARHLNREAAEEWAEDSERPLNWLGYELIDGAEPALLLKKIAVALDQAFQSPAALDFINAAIVLEPTRLDFLFTRALILMSLGLKGEAARDAELLAEHSEEQSHFLQSYLRGLFSTYGFVPDSEPPQTTFDDVPSRPERSLGDIQLLVQKYATRLLLVREKLLDKVTEENTIVPPALVHLLPAGPVSLEQGYFELAGENGEEQQIDYDEKPELDGLDIPSLTRLARADWGALSWLCWACGLSSVSFPKQLAPPADFGLAAGMAQQRLWRSRDQRVFNGRNAAQHGVPSFLWEGLDVGELNPSVASIAEQQYAEMQALFYWLIDSGIKNPWQDNLRGS